MKHPLTIVIPTREEEKIILKTLKELREKVKTPHQIIVVNDHGPESFDQTEKLVRKYSQTYKNISLIIRKDKSKFSFASALAVGFNKVESGVVVPVMADMCDQPETIDKMYQKICQGWDIVCGSRYMRGGQKKGGPFVQSFFSKLVCLTLYWLTGIPTHDVSNAFKMYRKNILEKLKINSQNGVEVSMAITLQAYFQGARITEIPTRWTGRTIGQSKFRIFKRTPRYWKIYWWAIKNSLREHLGLQPVNMYNE